MPELLQPENLHQVQAAPLHPLETATVDVLSVCLNLVSGKGGWPWERLQVALSFTCHDDQAFGWSTRDIVLDEDGRCAGKVLAWMHLGYLCQAPRLMMECVAPRLTAEIAADLTRIRVGDRSAPAWEEIFVRITDVPHSQASDDAIDAGLWRSAARIVAMGHRLGECGCTTKDRWHAIPESMLTRVASGGLTCPSCREAVLLKSVDGAPKWVQDEIAYLKRERARRTPAATDPIGSKGAAKKVSRDLKEGSATTKRAPAKSAAAKKAPRKVKPNKKPQIRL